MRVSLEERQGVGRDLANLSQIIGVADLGQLRALLWQSQTGQIVGLVRINSGDVALHRFGKRSFTEELCPRRGSHARHQAVLAKGLGVEETCGAEFVVKLLIVSFVEALRVNSNFPEKRFCNVGISVRTLNRLRASVAQ